MEVDSSLGISDICEELGLKPQFLLFMACTAAEYYTVFNRAKRSGGTRLISASQDTLKSVQRLILDRILSRLPMPLHVHGGVKFRSIGTNAQFHLNQDIVLNIDLSNFFDSVTFSNVMKLFQEVFHFDWESAEVLARLTTLNECLPQGAPTSPALANIAALALDEDIIGLCTQKLGSGNFQYTRYIDDITISGGKQVPALVDEIYALIDKQDFRANQSKTKILRRSSQQRVTGIIVNKRLNPPKKMLRRLRQELYFCEKFGIAEHCERMHLNPEKFVRRLRGQIAYIKIVRPDLAQNFTYTLGVELPMIVEISKEEEDILIILTRLVDDGGIATINYNDQQFKIAPASIYLDDEGRIVVHAFQLTPEQGWQQFFVWSIESIELEGVSLR